MKLSIIIPVRDEEFVIKKIIEQLQNNLKIISNANGSFRLVLFTYKPIFILYHQFLKNIFLSRCN